MTISDALQAAQNASPEELAVKLMKDGDLRKHSLQQLVEGTGHTQLSFKLSDGSDAVMSITRGKDLSQPRRTDVKRLFEDNMKDLYIKSQNGYNAQDKDADIFGDDGGDEPAVLLLITRPNSPELLAFSSFRFVQDDTMDDVKMVDVCYCYEVQVSSGSRGLGLGKILMKCLESFARACKLEQVTLTVFEFNESARKFYKKLGYTPDETCPSRLEWEDAEEKPDYLILSRSMRPKTRLQRKR